MDIVKKNLASFIFAAIALIALIALFFPTSGWFESLDAEAQKRKGVFNELRTLMTRARNAPTIDPDSTEPVQLDAFPSDTYIERGQKVTAEVEQQSQQMYRAAVDLNKKPLLVEGVLPRSGDTAKFRFREQYISAMSQTLPHEILKSGIPPTQDAVERARTALWRNEYEPRIQVFSNGQSNKPQLDEQWKAEADKLPERLTTEVAHRAKIYLDPKALTVQPGFEGTSSSPTPENIWWAQVGFWIQREVCEAIAATNAQAASVIEAPVKRLMVLQVPAGFVFETGAQAPPGGAPDPTQPVNTSPSISATGRVSNPMYDVIHFKMEVIVEADKIPDFFKELSRNRFITVMKVDSMTTVDSAVHQATGYYYGKRPVVKLVLNCETLLLREWTVPLMPPAILQKMGIQPGAEPVASR